MIAITVPNSNYIPENQHQSVAMWREDFPQRDCMQTGRTPSPAPSDRCTHTTIIYEGGNCPLLFTILNKQWLKRARCDGQRTCALMGNVLCYRTCCVMNVDCYVCLFTHWRVQNQWGLVGVRACFCRAFPFLKCFFSRKGLFILLYLLFLALWRLINWRSHAGTTH